MTSTPPVKTPGDSAYDLFNFHRELISAAQDADSPTLDSVYRDAQLALLAKIAIELEKMNGSA